MLGNIISEPEHELLFYLLEYFPFSIYIFKAINKIVVINKMLY